MSMFQKIKIYIENNNSSGEFVLQDDGDGPYIKTWNVEGLSQPTSDDLENISVPDLSYIQSRKQAYGSIEKQIEFIAENGLSAWQDRVSQIKQQYPKGE